MATLIDNVLESSRLLARKKRLDLEPIDLGHFLAGYFDDVKSRLAGRDVDLAVDVATAASVLATADALHRVMDNLVDNAVRFSDPGGEVRCRVSDEEQMVRIEVEDDGIGIPKKELGKIFDRFYQIGRPTAGRRSGSGLGLSIVDGLVREMRGTVRAFSQEGRPGTRFVVELPRLGDAKGDRGDASGAPRILVVEDEEAIAEGLRLNLERKQYAVDLAADGREALARAADGRYDLIVLDVRLPEIDGFEVCRRLRDGSDFTPILILTARSQPDDVVYGLKLGADDYLVKPFDLAELLARVEGLLRRRAWEKREGAANGGGAGGRRPRASPSATSGSTSRATGRRPAPARSSCRARRWR